MAETRELTSKKMREQPIGKLLLTMSLPAVFSMLVQAMYNVVDTIFVSQKFGKPGLSALSIAMPMQLLFMSFAIGIGVGTNVQIAKKLGQGKNEEASNIAKTGIILSVVMSAVFLVLAFTVVKPFMNFFAAGDAEVKEMGITYLTLCMSCSGFIFVEICCTKILQATGNMKLPMISQLIGAGTNIILDPLLIFGYGFPEMGVMGAALATVIGQVFSMLFVVIMFIVKKHDVSLSPKGFAFKKSDVKDILIIGLPVTVMNALMSFAVIVLNTLLTLLIPSSASGVPILGAYLKLNSFVFMPVFGMTQGLLPILSYNYGRGDKRRYMQAYRLAVISALAIMSVGLLLFQVIPKQLIGMFVTEKTFLAEGAYALRIISISFLFAAFNIVITTCNQSLSKGFTSLIMSLLRQAGVLIPVAALLGKLTGLNGFWFAYPIAEAVVFAIFLPNSLRMIKKKFAGLSLESAGGLSPAAEFSGARGIEAIDPFIEKVALENSVTGNAAAETAQPEAGAFEEAGKEKINA